MTQESFEFSEGTSDKFWTISLQGDTFTVHFGRKGTNGQTQTKNFSSAQEAKTAYDKLVAEKVKKGYIRISGAPAGHVEHAVPHETTAAPITPAHHLASSAPAAPIVSAPGQQPPAAASS